MTQHDAIYSTLSGASAVSSLVGTRIYPYIAPENASAPFITFQAITELNNNLLDGGRAGRNMRWQINCYATTPNGAEALGDAVEGALKSTGYVVFRQTTYDDVAQLFWTQVDWSTFVAAA